MESGYNVCEVCGAAIADKERHDRWHNTDLVGQIKKTVDDALQRVSRQVQGYIH